MDRRPDRIEIDVTTGERLCPHGYPEQECARCAEVTCNQRGLQPTPSFETLDGFMRGTLH